MKQLLLSRLVCAFALFAAPIAANAQSETPVIAPESPSSRSVGVTILAASSGVNISGPTTICQGGETILKAEGDYESFEWNTGATERFLKVRNEGTYEVTVTTKGGCKLTTSVTVRVIPCT
ncbi:MAG: hypothetical protein ACKVUS_11605 [Saprospiraceae bacterium]